MALPIALLARGISRPLWTWTILGLALLLYASMYMDGAVHGSAVFGSAGLKLNYVHEFFHHARHLAFACH